MNGQAEQASHGNELLIEIVKQNQQLIEAVNQLVEINTNQSAQIHELLLQLVDDEDDVLINRGLDE